MDAFEVVVTFLFFSTWLMCTPINTSLSEISVSKDRLVAPKTLSLWLSPTLLVWVQISIHLGLRYPSKTSLALKTRPMRIGLVYKFPSGHNFMFSPLLAKAVMTIYMLQGNWPMGHSVTRY
jgi:hypothetical protein